MTSRATLQGKVAASEGGSGPEVGGGWAGAGGIGGLGGFTVAPHPLLGSMAAPGPDAQGGAGGDNPAKDMAALQNFQSMDWLFKKERIFLLAQFWQQVRELRARCRRGPAAPDGTWWRRRGAPRRRAEPLPPARTSPPPHVCRGLAYPSGRGLAMVRARQGVGAVWRPPVATVEARLAADRCGAHLGGGPRGACQPASHCVITEPHRNFHRDTKAAAARGTAGAASRQPPAGGGSWRQEGRVTDVLCWWSLWEARPRRSSGLSVLAPQRRLAEAQRR